MLFRTKMALYVSITVLLGVPLLFLFISMNTGHWLALMWAIPPALIAGLTGLIITINTIKKEAKTHN